MCHIKLREFLSQPVIGRNVWSRGAAGEDAVAKAYVNQIARGAGYPSLNDVVGITICDFVFWPDTEGCQLPMLTRWRMTEQKTGAKELGQIQLVFLELPKYDTSRPP